MTEEIKPKLTKEEIAADKQRRAQEFTDALNALCQEHDCDIVAVAQIIDGRIVSTPVVQPR